MLVKFKYQYFSPHEECHRTKLLIRGIGKKNNFQTIPQNLEELTFKKFEYVIRYFHIVKLIF